MCVCRRLHHVPCAAAASGRAAAAAQEESRIRHRDRRRPARKRPHAGGDVAGRHCAREWTTAQDNRCYRGLLTRIVRS